MALAGRGLEAAAGQSVGGVGQASAAQPGLVSQSDVRAFQQEQQGLARERQALVDHGATSQQVAAWREQNAGRFAALQQHAQVMALASQLQARPANAQPHIPPNASPALVAYLTTQASLANARAQIHNQVVQQLGSSGQNVSQAQLNQMERQQLQQFRQQHAAELQLQAQRAQTIAAESTRNPLPLPPAPRIPANATPQMAAYLTAQNQLMRERIQLRNQYANATPEQRQAAMAQWRQQNAQRIQQVQAPTQNFSQANQ